MYYPFQISVDNVHTVQIHDASCDVCQLPENSINNCHGSKRDVTREGRFTRGFLRRYLVMFSFSIHSEIMTNSEPCMYAPSKGRVLGFESLFHMITSRQNLYHESQQYLVPLRVKQQTSFCFSRCTTFTNNLLIATVILPDLPFHTAPNPPV